MTKNKFNPQLIVALCLGILVTAAITYSMGKNDDAPDDDNTMSDNGAMKSELRAERVITDWPEASRNAATEMIQKYGQPQVVGANCLIWEDKGPWVGIKVDKEEISHRFPFPHTDMLAQEVAYKVPTEMYDDLAEFDGSLIVERTKGTMTARCDKEENNFLALNLAHDIITGNMSVDEARQAYTEKANAAKSGQKDEYMQKLRFREFTLSQTVDPDAPVTQSSMDQEQ